jgi:hypothetical protein
LTVSKGFCTIGLSLRKRQNINCNVKELNATVV